MGATNINGAQQAQPDNKGNQPPVTADSITDDQLRDLRMRAVMYGNREVALLCNDALSEGRSPREKTPRDAARAQCAAILSALEQRATFRPVTPNVRWSPYQEAA